MAREVGRDQTEEPGPEWAQGAEPAAGLEPEVPGEVMTSAFLAFASGSACLSILLTYS